MAYLVEMVLTPGSGNVAASPRTGGTGTAAASYPITQVASHLHTITIAEALLGPWALVAGDGNSIRVLEFISGKESYPLGDSQPIAAAVLAAAAANPIHSNIKQIDDEPVKPIDEDKIICKKKLEVS